MFFNYKFVFITINLFQKSPHYVNEKSMFIVLLFDFQNVKVIKNKNLCTIVSFKIFPNQKILKLYIFFTDLNLCTKN